MTLVCRMNSFVVEYDYAAKNSDELSIHKGDIIHNAMPCVDDNGWMKGECNGKPFTKEKAKHRTFINELNSKVLQASSVNNNNSNNSNKGTLRKRLNERSISLNSNNTNMNVQPAQLEPPTPSQSQQPVLFTVKVVYAYNPVHPDELTIKPNDIINVIRIVEDGWNEGELNGKIGVFPTNYVTRISDEATNSKTKKDPVKRKTNGISTLVNKEIMKPYIPVTLSSLPTQTPVTPSPPLTTKKNSFSNTQNPVVRARVLYAYNQSAPDELTLNVGDIVNVLEKNLEDDGWYIRKDRPNTPETQKYASQTLPKTKTGNEDTVFRNSNDTQDHITEQKPPSVHDHYAEINNLDAITNTEKLSNFSKPRPSSSKRPPSSTRLSNRYENGYNKNGSSFDDTYQINDSKKERPLHSPSPPQSQRDPSQLESPRSRADFSRTLSNPHSETSNRSLNNNQRENTISSNTNNPSTLSSTLMDTMTNSSYVNTTSSLQNEQSLNRSQLEQLQKDLEQMKITMEHMRAKFHDKISILVNELDDEKKARSKLQIELERVQRTISTSGLFDKIF
ncbi:unnamed protein product [Didymodactylos carnosus]|uniref:SH3 domain-containing protein n=1 Tax=Didymodactylos carnosus TaxID=1234261 RepID=A0A8S2IZL0_9BILA|nr:unnamed protein product [Didymodactylos carnosus]CAF3773501.1 unnamed protein product [Didymodactylos carnosus]